MPMRVAAMAYPLVAMALIARKNAAIGPFVDVDAFSPETARKPESLKVDYRSVRRALRAGVLVAVGDGRYFVDQRAWKKRFLRNAVVFGGIGAVFLGLVFFPEIAGMLG